MNSSQEPQRPAWTWAVAALAVVLLAAGVYFIVPQSHANGRPGDVVAEIGDDTITFAELEGLAAGQLRQLESQRFKILTQVLQQTIDGRLLDAEAEARGVTTGELLEAEVASKSAEISDAEVDAWYEENKARVRRPKAEVAEQIRGFLSQQGVTQRRAALIQDLRQRHGVKVHLEPPRVELGVEGARTAGPEKAAVTIVEFSDFQCPACRGASPALKQVLEAYPDQVQVAFRHFPLESIHPQARKASEAALCAGDQGKFWEMHDILFENQRALAPEQLKEHARSVGLESESFDRCLDSGRYDDRVTADLEIGEKAGVGGTPTLFVNGRSLVLMSNRPAFEQIAEVVDEELARLAAR